MKTRILTLLAFGSLVFSSCEKISFEETGQLVPLTAKEDPSIPAINVNGILLHSESFGNPTDPMIIAIHGGPGADYRSILNFKQLSDDGMFVVFYDQRGCGLSERLDKSAYSAVQVYIDELDGVINHYKQNPSQKVILAGHSWGAMLASAYVNQYPSKIEGLILAEPGGLTWDQTLNYIQKSRKLELFAETTNDLVYQDQFITGDDHNTLDYKMAISTAGEVTTGDVAPPPFWRYGGICNSASIALAVDNPGQMDFTTNLNNYNKKVLFAYSQLNTAYGPEHAQLVSAAFPNTQLIEILDCGHEMPHFGWNNFYPFIKNYLNEIL